MLKGRGAMFGIAILDANHTASKDGADGNDHLTFTVPPAAP